MGNHPGKLAKLYITPRHDMLKNVIDLQVTAEDWSQTTFMWKTVVNMKKYEQPYNVPLKQ